jgi:MYXO-CTERM domain-containing protein
MKHSAVIWPGIVAAALVLPIAERAALADVVAPPEGGECPPGTEGGASHGLNPSHCTVLACATDADCTNGESCQEVQLCTDGYWAWAACSAADPCEGTTPCTPVKVCASGDVGNEQGGACSCRLSAAGHAERAALALAIGCALLAVRRRKSAAPPARRR